MGTKVGVERIVSTSKGSVVGVDSPKIIEVVEKCHDQLQSQGFCLIHYVVKSRNAVVGVVVDILARGVEHLVVDIGLGRGGVGVSKSPGSNSLVTGLVWSAKAQDRNLDITDPSNFFHCLVDIRIGEKVTEPPGIDSYLRRQKAAVSTTLPRMSLPEKYSLLPSMLKSLPAADG